MCGDALRGFISCAALLNGAVQPLVSRQWHNVSPAITRISRTETPWAHAETYYGGHHCAPQPSRYTISQQTDNPAPLHGSTQEGPPPLLRGHLPSRTLPSEKKERNRHSSKGYCKLELRRTPAAPAEKGQNFVTIARRRKKERPEGPAGNGDWARRGIAEGHWVTRLSFRTSPSAL